MVSAEAEFTAKNIRTEGAETIHYSKQLAVRGAIVNFRRVKLPAMIGHRPPLIFHMSQQSSTKCTF